MTCTFAHLVVAELESTFASRGARLEVITLLYHIDCLSTSIFALPSASLRASTLLVWVAIPFAPAVVVEVTISFATHVLT